MAELKVSYDEKAKKVVVECANVFDDYRKTYKDVLELKPLQVYVEVPLDDEGSSAGDATDTVKTNLTKLSDSVRKEIADLSTTLRQLQKEEEHGNKKAATEAEKQVKSAEKSVKKWAGEFGAEARKVVQKALKTGKLRSASRTNFRGMELNEDAFDESAEGSEPPAYVGELSKSLASLGKELFKLTVQEKELRKDLGLEIERIQQVVEKARAGKSSFDIKEFLKANTKEGRALEGSAAKYGDFIASLKEKLDEAKDKWTKLNNLIDKNEKLDEDKNLGKAMDKLEEARGTIADTLTDKMILADGAKRLFKDDYGSGAEWLKLVAKAQTLKGAAKSGKSMQDLGAELEKKFK